MSLNWLLNAAHALIVVNSSLPAGSRSIAGEKNETYGDDDQLKMAVIGGFRMPLHYPRYAKSDYEKMEEWKVDLLLREYGINFEGSLDEKRSFAIGAFLWPGQY